MKGSVPSLSPFGLFFSPCSPDCLLVTRCKDQILSFEELDTSCVNISPSQELFALLKDLNRQSSTGRSQFKVVDFVAWWGSYVEGFSLKRHFPILFGEGGMGILSLPSSPRMRRILLGLSNAAPPLSNSSPSPQGLRGQRTHHPGHKPPQDPPLPSSRLGSGRGEAGPEMPLSPSGREGLLSSCPTGGGQGRSLMTLMSTGASSSREERHRQGQKQRQRQREAEVETPKPELGHRTA